jgi:hypothetical protein
MVLISIHPFALRKLFLFVVALVCFSAFCFADPVLMVRQSGSAKVTERTNGLPTSTQVVGMPGATLNHPAEKPLIFPFSFSAARLRGCEWRSGESTIEPDESGDLEMRRI